MVYLIHFHQPLKHARHYLGYCKTNGLKARLQRHADGSGSKLMKAVIAAGITYEVVKVWPDADRAEERRMKVRGGGSRFCPICKALRLTKL